MPFATAYVPVNIAPDGTYALTAQVVYQGRDDTFTVPAGFVTDLASVPQWLTWLVPIQGVGDRAAIVHDWLCTQLERHGVQVQMSPANARDTDGIFRRILRELGVGRVRRTLYWLGVRWGALANPARRDGWWRDAPVVLPLSLLALPWLLLACVPIFLTLAVDRAVEAIFP